MTKKGSLQVFAGAGTILITSVIVFVAISLVAPELSAKIISALSELRIAIMGN